jgi:hypothetical protein
VSACSFVGGLFLLLNFVFDPMFSSIADDCSEKIRGGSSGLHIGSPRSGALPSISVSPSISPVVIVAPFLRTSQNSFNFTQITRSFNAVGNGMNTFSIGNII